MVRLPDQDAEVEQRCQCPGKHGDPERVGKQDEPGQGRVVVGGVLVGKVHLGRSVGVTVGESLQGGIFLLFADWR